MPAALPMVGSKLGIGFGVFLGEERGRGTWAMRVVCELEAARTRTGTDGSNGRLQLKVSLVFSVILAFFSYLSVRCFLPRVSAARRCGGVNGSMPDPGCYCCVRGVVVTGSLVRVNWPAATVESGGEMVRCGSGRPHVDGAVLVLRPPRARGFGIIRWFSP